MIFCDRCFKEIEDCFVRATIGIESFDFCDMDCYQEYANLGDLEGCTLEFIVIDNDEKC